MTCGRRRLRAPAAQARLPRDEVLAVLPAPRAARRGRAGGRVAKGMRMAGRMGSDRITIKNLSVLAVDAQNNIMIVKGAVPGKPGTLLEIKG